MRQVCSLACRLVALVCLLALSAPASQTVAKSKPKPLGPDGVFYELQKRDDGTYIIVITGHGRARGYYLKTVKEVQKKLDRIYFLYISDGITEVEDFDEIGTSMAQVSQIVHLRLPDGLQRIGPRAIPRKVRNVEIPATVREIGPRAFANCRSLNEITVPASVQKLGHGAFSGCASLTQVIFSGACAALPDDCFKGCVRLGSVQFPSGLKRIGNSAFFDCRSLVFFSLPKSLEQVGDSAFYISDQAGGLLTRLDFPKTTTSIGEAAFAGQKMLLTIKFDPSTTVTIARNAFRDAKELSELSLPSWGKFNAPLFGGSIFDGTIINLPHEGNNRYESFITESNCAKWGISKSAFQRYLNGNNTALVNTRGEQLLEKNVDRKVVRVADVNPPCYIIKQAGDEGVIDDNGKWILPLASNRQVAFVAASANSQSRFKVTQGAEVGYMGLNGQWISAPAKPASAQPKAGQSGKKYAGEQLIGSYGYFRQADGKEAELQSKLVLDFTQESVAFTFYEDLMGLFPTDSARVTALRYAVIDDYRIRLEFNDTQHSVKHIILLDGSNAGSAEHTTVDLKTKRQKKEQYIGVDREVTGLDVFAVLLSDWNLLDRGQNFVNEVKRAIRDYRGNCKLVAVKAK